MKTFTERCLENLEDPITKNYGVLSMSYIDDVKELCKRLDETLKFLREIQEEIVTMKQEIEESGEKSILAIDSFVTKMEELMEIGE